MHRIALVLLLCVSANVFGFCTKLALKTLGGFPLLVDSGIRRYYLAYGLAVKNYTVKTVCADLRPHLAFTSKMSLQNQECTDNGMGFPDFTKCHLLNGIDHLLSESEIKQFKIFDKLSLPKAEACDYNLQKSLGSSFANINQGSIRYWRVLDEKKNPLTVKTALVNFRYRYTASSLPSPSSSLSDPIKSPTPLQIGVGAEVHCPDQGPIVDLTRIPAYHLKRIPFFANLKGTLSDPVPGYRIIQNEPVFGTTYIVRTTLK